MLKVYKASAGSGKTYNLTKEYLTLLFNSRPDEGYKHILAVTFTNKATQEMKDRILGKLNELAEDPVKSPYYKDISTLVNQADPERIPELVKEKAKAIQKCLLHDYSRFSVSTIDSFFQRTMRAFAREIGESPSYQVVLDPGDVIAAAFDRMFDSLGVEDKEHKRLLGDITSYASDLIDDGEGWDFSGPLVEASYDFLKESFRLKITDEEFQRLDIANLKSGLSMIVRSYEAEMKAIGEASCKVIKDARLECSSFKGGSRSSAFYFQKVADGLVDPPSETLLEWGADPTAWCSKSSPDKDAISGCVPALYKFLMQAKELYDRDFVAYNSARITLSRFYVLAVFSALKREMAAVLEQNDSVLLGDTPEVLSRIIGDQDAPFVYEKIGIRYNHYMLDEFQDTSKLQWYNFFPLLDESLASGNESLVVGDVKQSIYRWRNSEWSLLMGIDRQFPKKVEEDLLDTNFRSSPVVVDFNNGFFCSSPATLQDEFNREFFASGEPAPDDDHSKMYSEILTIYSDYKQKVSDKNSKLPGHVLMDVVKPEDGSDYVTSGYFKAEGTKRALAYVAQLHENGYAYKDIMLLVRTGDEVMALTKALVGEGISVSTDEQLELSSSPAVLKIVSTLRVLLDSHNPLNQYLKRKLNILDVEIGSRPLYEAVLEIIRKMEELDGPVKGREVAFVNAFLDNVRDYVHDNGSDPKAFIAWWDEVGKGKCISSSKGCDSVSVMTVHKAKGLESKAVILPFFNFDYHVRNDYYVSTFIWCSPSKTCGDIAAFKGIPVASVPCNPNLKNSIYADDYRREVLSTMIDGLNIAYVACTRAKNEMIIIAPQRNYSKTTIGTILVDYMAENYVPKPKDPKEPKEVLEYELGQWTDAAAIRMMEEDKEDGNDDVGPESLRQSEFIAVPIGERLHLTLQGGDFFQRQDSPRGRGTVLHAVMASIDRPEDLDAALKDALIRGELRPEQIEDDRADFGRMLESVSALHWFDGTYDSFKECDILTPDGEVVRPDRVLVPKDGSKAEAIVIDFKFGWEKFDKYKTQVAEYMSKLEAMGYASVIGNVWYCSMGEIDTL
jgi:ATP-dependent helicase/nuclease subunit A